MQMCCILEGQVRVTTRDGEFVVEGPQVARFPEAWEKGAEGHRTMDVEICGPRVRAVHVHYRSTPTGFEQFATTPDLLALLESYHAQALAPSHPLADDAPERTLLECLASQNLIAASARSPSPAFSEPAPFLRLWTEIQRVYGDMSMNPSVKTLAASLGISRRHLSRNIKSLTDSYLFPPGGFQELFLMLRLSVASLLLSNPNLSVSEVAERVGYARPEALTSAHRRGGIPSPIEIKGEYETRRARNRREEG